MQNNTDPLTVPKGKAYLEFQECGIRWLLQRSRCLLADEMGLGKTIQTIGVWNNDLDIHRILVICPATLKLNWAREFEAWSTRPITIDILDRKHKGFAHRKNVTIMSYETAVKLEPWLISRGWHLLVVDEAHYLKNPKAKRTEAILGFKKTKKAVKAKASRKATSQAPGRRAVEAQPERPARGPIPAKQIFFLTGTPILNRPIELWPLLRALDPKGLGSSWWKYVQRYCGAWKSPWGWELGGASHLEELADKIASLNVVLRRTKEMVLRELPEKRRQIIQLPTGRVHQKIIDKEKRIYATHREAVKSHSKEKIQIAFQELAEARKAVAMAKLPATLKLIEQAFEYGPVVVFAHHHDVIDAIAEKLSCVVVTGKTAESERQLAVDTFQMGKVDCFIGNIQAAGVGITLTAASHIVFAEIVWTPALMSQAEDRCHRIGQTQSLLIQYPVLEGSLDQRMLEVIVRKQDIISKVTDKLTQGKDES